MVDHKKTWLIALALLLLAEVCVRLTSVQPLRSSYDMLVDHQVQKLDGVTEETIVLVGDSSLGNGLDAALLSRELGRPVLNLALTGVDSFLGAEMMIRAMVARGKKPKFVVVFVCLETLGREVSERSRELIEKKDEEPDSWFERTAAWPFQQLALVEKSPAYRHGFLERGAGVRFSPVLSAGDTQALHSQSLSERDYISQSEPKDWSRIRVRPLRGLNLHPTQEQALKGLVEACAELEVQLTLDLAPMHEVWLSEPEVEQRLNHWLDSTGIRRVKRELVTYPGDRFGDTLNHLNTQGRQEFSQRYAEILRSLLEGASNRQGRFPAK